MRAVKDLPVTATVLGDAPHLCPKCETATQHVKVVVGLPTGETLFNGPGIKCGQGCIYTT